MHDDEFDQCLDGVSEAEGEVAVARLVLDRGDLPHALRHLADAFALEPLLPDAHEALGEFVARAGGPEPALDFFGDDDEDHDFIGTVAVRAHVCVMAELWDEAAMCLLRLAAHQPDRPWLDVAWLMRDDLGDLVEPEIVAEEVARLAEALEDPVDEDDRAPLLPALNLLRATVRQNPDHATLLWCGSMLARRLGAVDEAIEWTDRSFALEPSNQAVMMKGYALRSAGRLDDALAVWIGETERVPENLDVYLDVADLLYSMDRPEEALEWAERAHAKDPHHHRAAPTMFGLRYAVHGDVSYLVALADVARERPDFTCAHDALAKHCHEKAWLGLITDAADGLIGLLFEVLADNEPGDDLNLRMVADSVQPPSAAMTVKRAFPGTRVLFESAPEPDARKPVRPVRYAVWEYRGMKPITRLPEVLPDTSLALQRLTSIRWVSPPEAYDRAIVLSGIDPTQLLAVMADPPMPPDTAFGYLLEQSALQLWFRSVQVWACLGIAHCQSEEPWLESTRREILKDLLYGPEDWVSEAAGFALIVTAWVDPSTRPDVHDLVLHRAVQAAMAHQEREVSILMSLCRLVLILPELDEDAAGLFRDLLKSFDPDS